MTDTAKATEMVERVLSDDVAADLGRKLRDDVMDCARRATSIVPMASADHAIIALYGTAALLGYVSGALGRHYGLPEDEAIRLALDLLRKAVEKRAPNTSPPSTP